MSKLLGEVKLGDDGREHVDFKDDNGDRCRLIQSVPYDEDALWLTNLSGESSIFLTMDLLAELLPILQHWVETKQLSGAPANHEPTREELLACLKNLLNAGDELDAARLNEEEDDSEENMALVSEAEANYRKAMAQALKLEALSEGREL